MSATLTWNFSGLGTKTGTAVAAYFTDLKALVDSKNGDSNFKWTVASSSLAGTPYYVVLKRKDGSAGRILFICWTSSPAGNNSAILEAAPSLNALNVAYFPAGNVDTPSNLTASSGTIMGDDTGVIKCCNTTGSLASDYSANVQIFYADSTEAFALCSQNPASSARPLLLAGDFLIDASDVAYAGAGVITSPGGFGSTTSSLAWTSSDVVAGNGTVPVIRTNYGSADRLYFAAWAPSAGWASSPISSSDILSDTSNNKIWFVPFQLLGTTKGEGFVLKLRQIAMGPGTTSAFTSYSTTGPVVQARQLNANSGGGNGYPWMTNFKL